MPKIEVIRAHAPEIIGDREPHWIVDVDYGAFQVSIPLPARYLYDDDPKTQDASPSKLRKVSPKLYFALRNICENDGRVIGIDLLADHIAHVDDLSLCRPTHQKRSVFCLSRRERSRSTEYVRPIASAGTVT